MPEHFCLLHSPDLLHSDSTLISISVFVTLSPCLCLAWSQLQLPTLPPHAHPSLMPLPQGVAAIVVPNKVYGITDLWNWIFSLHQSIGITGLRPGASGHNWPVSELLFSYATLKVGRSRDWCANSSGGRQKDRQIPCIRMCTWQLNWFWLRQLFGSYVWISVALTSTTLTHSSSVCPRNFWLCLI